jgi:hypothetical protein
LLDADVLLTDKLQRVAAILAELREDVEKHRLSQESMFITHYGLFFQRDSDTSCRTGESS